MEALTGVQSWWGRELASAEAAPRAAPQPRALPSGQRAQAPLSLAFEWRLGAPAGASRGRLLFLASVEELRLKLPRYSSVVLSPGRLLWCAQLVSLHEFQMFGARLAPRL